MSLIVEAYSKKEIKKLAKIKSVDIIVVGIEFLSLDFKTIDFEELDSLISICNKNQKKLAINMERIFHEDDLYFVKMILKNKIMEEISYFIYSDLGIYQLMVELGYSDKLIYRSPSYLTNYEDVLIFEKLNRFVVLSDQITIDELKNLTLKIKDNYYLDVLGYGCPFYSKRPLVSNYLRFKNIKLDVLGKLGYIKEETRTNKFLIKEDDAGTRVYEENPYLLTLELEYFKKAFFLHHFNIKDKIYLAIVKIFDEYLKDEITLNELDEKVKMLNIPFMKGAYYNKTVLLKEDAK